MVRKFAAVVFGVILLLSSVGAVSARTVRYVAPVPTPSPKPVVVETVNSFELFWPMVAGKTMQSRLFFLKTIKEKVRGFLIFGKAEKADYDVFLGIKRMLEAEVLMKANLNDLANKTLDSAASDLDSAAANIDAAKASGDIAQNVKDDINTRVANLKKFTAFLISQDKDYKDKLQSISDKLNLISSKI